MCPVTGLELLIDGLELSADCAVNADKVIARLRPVITELRKAKQGSAAAWLTIKEAMTKSGKSLSYFRAPLVMFDSQSRLECWLAEGHARRKGQQWWFFTRGAAIGEW